MAWWKLSAPESMHLNDRQDKFLSLVEEGMWWFATVNHLEFQHSEDAGLKGRSY
jgi:hypothetical protein